MGHKQLLTGAKRVWLRSLNAQPTLTREKIAIALHDRVEVIRVRDIIYLKADSNYTHIHLADGTSLMTSNTLRRFEEILHSPQFLRVHSSFMVQASFIKSMASGGTILLSDDTTVPASRAKKHVVTTFLKTIMI